VGKQTAGAVVSGTPTLLSDGSLLTVASIDLEVDGIRLEGHGVKPDIEVPFTLPYSEGQDPQKDVALECLSKKVMQERAHRIQNAAN
jgi:carboxyl-terminal processing protease